MPPVTYLRITVKIHVRACSKNLISIMSMQYAFYPIKLSPFGKKKGSSELPKFHKGRTEPSGAKSFFLLFCFAISKTKFGQAADVIV